MLIYFIILFYLFLIIYQIYNSIILKEGYRCLDKYDKPYNDLCIKDDNDEDVCLRDRVSDLCNLDTRLNELVEKTAPEKPPS